MIISQLQVAGFSSWTLQCFATGRKENGGEEIYWKKTGFAMNVSLKHHEKQLITIFIILISSTTIILLISS